MQLFSFFEMFLLFDRSICFILVFGVVVVFVVNAAYSFCNIIDFVIVSVGVLYIHAFVVGIYSPTLFAKLNTLAFSDTIS